MQTRMMKFDTAQGVIIIESRRRRRDDEPTIPDDVTLPDVNEDADDEGVRGCARSST
jgi:hypothetical protein